MNAAVVESRRSQSSCDVEIHTGYWGCGAFGGNRSLMALIQLLAARLAVVNRLVFHTGSQSEMFAFEEGQQVLEGMMNSSRYKGTVDSLLEIILERKFAWGVSDGN